MPDAPSARERALLADNLFEVVLALDHHGTVVDASSSLERIFARRVSDVTERPAAGLVHPADRRSFNDACAEAFTEPGRAVAMTFRLQHGNGAWRTIEAVARVQVGAATPVLLINALDVTGRKEAEAALRESARRYRRIFEEDLTGDFVATPEGRLLACNGAFARTFGFESGDAAIGCELRELLPTPEAWHKLNEMIRDSGGRLEYHEEELRRVDGRPVHVIGNLIGERNDDGALVEWRGYVFDVTERKKLEAQLRQALKMEAVGRLAGGIAHDFNNLLTVISGHSERLLSDLGDRDAGHRAADAIRKAAERAASLTQQLLAFSRKQVLAPRVLDLTAVVTNMDKLLRSLIGDTIELITRTAPDLGSVRADHSQIEQVIMNLAVNARDAMKTGGTLTIETANVTLTEEDAGRYPGARPGSFVMLAMADTGCGMDAETHAHLFEPFFTTKAQGKGTGLGLSTVYGIVKQSDGYVWAESEPGYGATFRIFLPRVDEPAEPIPADRPTPVIPQGSETVLLVEDEDDVRELLEETLRGHGYTVIAARNGGDALTFCAAYEHPIHLLVTDVVMPGMSGRELARRLAASRPDMKVLYLSGYADDEIVHHGVLEPDTAFLQKPFTLMALAEKVREVVGSR